MTGPVQHCEQHFERFRQSGDAAALAAVFDAVAPELLLVAAHVAPTGVEPEDLLQATFVDAIEHADRWDAQRRLMPWLIGVLVQHARAERRRAARRVDEARLLERDVDDPAVLVETADLSERVAAAVASMPVLYRQVLTLRLVHALTPTQIAAALGCPVATVKTRLQRGMELLRGALPAGLATSVALLCGSGRGLAQVKAAVLAKVGGAVPVATAGVAAVGWLGGTIAMKKFAVAVVALVCLTLALTWSPWSAAGDAAVSPTVEPPAAAQGAVVVSLEESAAKPDGVDAAAAVTREAVSAATATGEAALTFVWKHDGSPASGLHVTVQSHLPSSSSKDVFDGHADRQGRLRLDGLAPGNYSLFGPRSWGLLAVHAGQRVERRIEVEAALRCDGVVVDSSGRCVADADVFVQYFPNSADAAPRWMARSAADGTFHCATDHGGWFWARKPGRAASAIQEGQLEGLVMLRLELGGPAATLRGRVVGIDGRGATAAKVLILAQGDPATCAAPVEVVADQAGDFAVDELGVGPHLVVVEAAGHAASATRIEVQPGDGNRLDVRLGRGATIEGTVRDRDERALVARLEARPGWAGSQRQWTEALRPVYLRCVQRTPCAADGSYRLEHVPVGPVEVMAEPSREALADRRELLLSEGQVVRCDFWLQRSGAIRGRLVDPVGESLVGWTVSFEPVDGGRMARTETGVDGVFSQDGLDAERYRVTAAPPWGRDGVPWAIAEDVPKGADVLLRASARQEQGARMIGRALTRAGAPAGRLVLCAMPMGARQGQERAVVPDAEGRFVSTLLPPGRYRVTARIDDEGGVDLGERVVVAGVDVDLGHVQAAPCGMVELRFRDADGRWFAPDELSIFSAAGRCDAFDEVADGAYRSTMVPAGRYTLVARGPDFAQVMHEVEVVGDRTEVVEVSVSAACTVRFEVSAVSEPVLARPLSLEVHDAQDRWVGGANRLQLESGKPCSVRRGFAAGRHSFAVHEGVRQVASGTFTVGAADAAEVVVPVTVAD
ncbi:MAG: sigma-70 family RNA polymerase sigma factor [Planctomycetota bacterium]